MCTIIALNRVLPEYPLVVAANRDELYARPASGPRRLPGEDILVSGLDEEKGGTWMGATLGGLFVGLTNQRTFAPPDRTLASRGEIALGALRAGTIDGVDRLLAGLDPGKTNPFNLLYGDGATLRVAYARPGAGSVAVEDVSPGLHVLPNDRLDSPGFAKIRRVRALVEPLLGEPWPRLRAGLEAVLDDEVCPPLDEIPPPPPGSWITREVAQRLQAIHVRTPVYGTRTKTIAAVAPGRLAWFHARDGGEVFEYP